MVVDSTGLMYYVCLLVCHEVSSEVASSIFTLQWKKTTFTLYCFLPWYRLQDDVDCESQVFVHVKKIP